MKTLSILLVAAMFAASGMAVAASQTDTAKPATSTAVVPAAAHHKAHKHHKHHKATKATKAHKAHEAREEAREAHKTVASSSMPAPATAAPAKANPAKTK